MINVPPIEYRQGHPLTKHFFNQLSFIHVKPENQVIGGFIRWV
jgi:hypothetical protein